MSFSNSMEAKEFIISRIAQEARRHNTSLSELERKMLYFSEVCPTLPDMMEVAEKFEAEYDTEKYEKKIRDLSRKAFERDRKESPEIAQLWRDAIKVLRKEDHYVLVMLDVPGPATLDVPRSGADLAKLLVAGLVVAAMLVGAIAAIQWAGHNTHFRIPDYIKLLAFIVVFALACYLAYSDRGKKLGDWLGGFAERVARWF
jgi:glutaredoxin-related protein